MCQFTEIEMKNSAQKCPSLYVDGTSELIGRHLTRMEKTDKTFFLRLFDRRQIDSRYSTS